MGDWDRRFAKRMKIDSDGLEPSNSCSNNNGIHCGCCKQNSVECRTRFSCWDEIDSDWMDNASELEENRIYVHGDILEWIVQNINDYILNKNLRATVEEVCHHHLDGPIYLIKFYNISHKLGIQHATLIEIKDQLKYKMSWKPNPTYFLRVDSEFNNRRAQLVARLQKLNLFTEFSTTLFDINWLYIPKIEILEFSEHLSVEHLRQIESIFQEMSKSCPSIYICDQFIWHREVHHYIEVDKVVMDMCVEEWRRFDLLKYFSIDDILRIDLANKDYRDPYYNEYLDRYLDILLYKSSPQLLSNVKLEFPLEQFDTYLGNYFVSRFYDKISILCSSDKRFSSLINAYDIPIIEMCHTEIYLNDNEPSPDTLMNIKYHTIEYNISNYNHFSDSLFRALLSNAIEYQKYNVIFENDFQFKNDVDQKYPHYETSECNWTTINKKIVINLENGVQHNVELFVKYLIDLFKSRNKFDEVVALCFSLCTLEDYSFLANVGNCIDYIDFNSMNISSGQMMILSRALTEQTRVTFSNCSEITDANVMTLLENIDLDRLWIVGLNSCTPSIHFMIAEHIMDQNNKDVNVEREPIRSNNTISLTTPLDQLDFIKIDDRMVARNCRSNETVDVYCLLNGMNQNDSFDFSNNVYVE